MEVHRGEVFYADLSPVVGSEQGGVRPVLIVQNEIGNRHSPTVIKEWFFRENVRLAEEKERIFEERRKLEHEFRIKHDTLDKKISIAKLKIVQLDEATKLVEKKLAALEEEYVHLAIEKNKLAEERSTFETIRKNKRTSTVTYSGMDILFKGVRSGAALKKRYRELMKIFHPDNQDGDDSVIHAINIEYDRLKKVYG